MPITLGAKVLFKYAPALQRIAQGTTFEAIGKTELSELIVHVPPSKEQPIIAQILDTLDTRIQKTQALIAKLEKIKQGLLTDLLTRGLDQNGQLRPPPEQAPELYKESPLGLIPREWVISNVGTIAESLADGPFGSNLKTEHYIDHGGVRVVRLQNIHSGEYSDEDQSFISNLHASSLSRNKVLPGDVLIASLGDETHPVGRACIYPYNLGFAINKADCFRLRCRSGVLRNEIAMHFFNTTLASNQVRKKKQGVTLQRINLNNLKTLYIPTMPLKEQELISKALADIKSELEIYKTDLSKLAKEKSGLMDDLLTGRVRVTPLLEKAKQAEMA